MKKALFMHKLFNEYTELPATDWTNWLNPRSHDQLDTFKDFMGKTHIFDR